MSVPGRRDAAALLLSLDPPPWHRRHSRAVAEVAGWLAGRVVARSSGSVATSPRAFDRRLVEAAALLHDVDKALTEGDSNRRLRHGEGSAAWLTEHGHPELARAVSAHPVTRLVDEDWFRTELLGAPLEVRIVAYADKRAGQRLEPMAARFASWVRRYPPSRPGDGSGSWDEATLEAVWSRACVLEADVCAAAGVEPNQVERLPWTGPAIRDATRAGPAGYAGSPRHERDAMSDTP